MKPLLRARSTYQWFALSAGCTDTTRNDVMVILGAPWPMMPRMHERSVGSTVCAVAFWSLRPRAAQNARTACSAAAAWAADSVPDTRGGRAGPPPDPGFADLMKCDMLATCEAGGAATRTATPKS